MITKGEFNMFEVSSLLLLCNVDEVKKFRERESRLVRYRLC